MIAWKPNPFIFVHIPKCGGTSITAAILSAATTCQSLKALSVEERNKFWLPSENERQHSKLRDYALQYPIYQYFKFAFVRNPWDRALSQIDFLRRGRSSKCIFRGSSFKDYCRIYCQATKCVGGQDLGANQIDYILDESGKIGVDFVGRFETLDSDYKKICSIIGIDPAPILPHLKQIPRELHYTRYYDVESADWIKLRFKKDIECFGYKFD